MVIDFKNVSFRYTERKLLDEINFSLTDNDKVGLIGLNGSGKSTILKLIMNDEKAASGEIVRSGNMIVSYLSQDPVLTKGISFKEYVLSFSTKEHPIKEYEANTAITKMKLDPNRIIDNLSGGEKKRLALAKTLVSYCDFLLLDEPTNHLDIDMIEYLEKYLQKFNHGLLMVTHDRYFLEKCCNKMIELDKCHTYIYKANYSEFLKLKQERLENTSHTEEKIKKVLKNELEWIHSGVEARRTKSKSRIENYNELKKTEFSKEKSFEFNSKASYLGNQIIELKSVSKSYDKVLFKDFSLDVMRTSRLGIVGDNGCGKSTLFKVILGLVKPDSGKVILGQTLNIGYFTQHFEFSDLDITVLEYIEKESNDIDTVNGRVTARSLLEQFLFECDLLYTKLKSLSGGEKRRLQLVKVLSKNPNVLILDEPTNDLDIYTIEILENYLDSFNGPILCVSHDRYFLDRVVDEILYFKDKKINKYLGLFTDYLKDSDSVNSFKEKKTYKPKHTSIPSKLKRDIEKYEKEVKVYEKEISEMKNILTDSTSDYQLLIDTQVKLDEISKNYEEVCDKYLELLSEKEKYD